MNTESLLNINKNLFGDFASITNSKDRKGYNLIINGEKIKAKNSAEAAKIIYEKANVNLEFQDWWKDIKQDIFADATEKGVKTNELAKYAINELKSRLDDYSLRKIAERDDYTKVKLPDAFNADFTACSFKPSKTINEVDLDFLSGICYCKVDGLFYFKFNNNYTLIGDGASLTDKRSKELARLYGCIIAKRTVKTGQDNYDFWRDLYEITDDINSEYWYCAKEIETYLKTADMRRAVFNGDGDVSFDVFGSKYKLHEILQLKNFAQLGNESFDMKTVLHSFIVKLGINTKLPALMLNRNLANIYYETTADGVFKRYSLRSPNGNKCSMLDYLSKIFEESTILKTNVPALDEIPSIISDEKNTKSKFYIVDKWEDSLKGQCELSDAKGLKTFLAPYTTEEKIAIMGWAYTVFHPSCHDYINFLFKTGGGTFKTNYYSEQIVNILNVMYNPDTKIVHKMTNDQWTKDSFLREGTNSGISTSALIFNDECTVKSIEEFKNMSGGGKEGVAYQYRTMRENPVGMTCFAKWLFCTNNNIIIQDDSGAYDRRLFIIDRMDVKNLTPPFEQSELVTKRRSEMKAFYDFAKRCYDKACAEAGSFTKYVRTVKSIHRNIAEAYKSENKISAYDETYKMLLDKVDKGESNVFSFEDGSIGVSVTYLKSMTETILNNNELSWPSFRSFIANDDDYFIQRNMWRYKFKAKGKTHPAVVKMFPLKEEYTENLYEEVDIKENDIIF